MADPELSEDSLFDQAVGDAPAEPEAPVAEVIPEKPEGEVIAEPTAATERPAVDDNAPLVPSWRLREINEEKRGLADRLAALEAERANWQRQQSAKPVEPVVKVEKPDPLLDPEGYAKSVRDEIRMEILNERREESLQRAAETSPDEFKEAYAAAQKAVDPALRARMQGSRDPGKTLLEWHRENKVKAEVGSDPNAWLERKLEERLKDPSFLAKAVELARGSAQPQSNGRPRVELPPSLNGASRSNAALRSAMTADVDDDALFDQTVG